MKYLLFIPVVIFAFSCKKDVPICAEPTEIKNNTNHLVDLNLLGSTQFFNDTLKKYSYLQVKEIINNNELTSVFCNVYANNLLVFDGDYAFYYLKKANYTYSNIQLNELNIVPNLATPKISGLQAVDIAKRNQDFTNYCINYRLGLTLHNNQYRICYKVFANNCFYTMVDAENGNVLKQFNCIYH